MTHSVLGIYGLLTVCNAFRPLLVQNAWFSALVCFVCGCMATCASVWNVCPSDCCCWILDYMTVVWYDGDTFFYLLAWCIGDWASERYCDHMVCLCVCLSVNPKPNDVLEIRQYIAKYRNITIPPKLNRCKKFAQVSLNSTVMFTCGWVWLACCTVVTSQ